ncbi:MAG: hypothetical protein JSR39_09800 [Verrucomicrobia bacterium]|nr:hypothetical protein [Verrucomicrobiota bacterium]
MLEDKLPIGRIAFAKSACIDWVSDHSKTVLISLASLLILLFTLFQVTGKFSGSRRSDFIEAQSAYSAWVAAKISNDELFKKLEKPLKRSPELQAKFGALVAQHFLTINDPKNAEAFAKQSWKRTGNLLSPYYTEFSKTSLLVSQGKLQEALVAARGLKSKMAEDTKFWESRDKMIRSGGLLYAYNLIRIAALEKEVGTPVGELAAWDELLANAGWTSAAASSKMFDPEVYSVLQRTFQDGKLSLYDYIAKRKAELARNS